MRTHPNVRQNTCKILEMMEEGLLCPESIVRECLSYMSESEVSDMASRAGWLEDEESEEEEEEEEEERGFHIYRKGRIC